MPKANCMVKFNGKLYAAGENVPVKGDDLKRLIELGFVEGKAEKPVDAGGAPQGGAQSAEGGTGATGATGGTGEPT